MDTLKLPPVLIRKDFDSDEEYQEYLDIENADYSEMPFATPAQKESWKQVAHNTIKGKRKRITISIPERNLSRLRAKAMEAGVPYQTYLNMLIHEKVST